MSDPKQVLQNIDIWCQWDDTFGTQAEPLRQFFQERGDLLSALFKHFLAVHPKHSQPTDTWWRQWQALRATLPNDLILDLLLGLAKRDEWYRCLSDPAVEPHDELKGLTCETVANEVGHCTFELFLDADDNLRFIRASDATKKWGSEYDLRTWSPGENQYYQNPFFCQDTKFIWNEYARNMQVGVSIEAPDALFHPHAYWVYGSPSTQRAARQISYWGSKPSSRVPCSYISLKSHGRWYTRLPEPEATATHVISRAACWALSEFQHPDAYACLTEIALAYGRKKPGMYPGRFPSSFTEPVALEDRQIWHDNCSYSEMKRKYSTHDLRIYQSFRIYMWACTDQNQLSVIMENGSNVTYQRGAAAIWALQQSGTDGAISGLNQILVRALDKRFQKGVRTSLDTLAAARHLGREDLADQLVPTHQLSKQGKRSWEFDEYRVTLSLTPGGRVQRTIQDIKSKEYKNLPAKIREKHEEACSTLRSEEKSLVATLSQQKGRLEAAMVAGRCWSYERWQSLFASHPILSSLARRLIWNISATDNTHVSFAVPDEDGNWRDANNEIVQISSHHLLRIAHPVEIAREEHTLWQRAIVASRLVQPFKQAFREIYVLTPAEEQTERYSNRFAGQRLHTSRLHGVARGRGWTGSMGHDSEGDGIGWRDFPERKVRACFWTDTAGTVTLDDHNINILYGVAFFPDGQKVNGYRHEGMYVGASLLQEVPAVAFSETMRDLDLFVTMTHVDPDQERQYQPAYYPLPTYQERDGAFVEQSTMRAALLRELIPILDLTEQVHIEEHMALIRGKRAEYRIHLGSGNIYLQPRGQYLCIVVPRVSPGDVYLPFEETDTKTVEILSKVLLLVQDEQITDPTILRQIVAER